MGVIKDIVNIIVPGAQRRIEEGICAKEALYIEFKEMGYISDKSENMSKEVRK